MTTLKVRKVHFLSFARFSSQGSQGSIFQVRKVQFLKFTRFTLEIMSDSDVEQPSASSTESCDTSYSSSREEMEVASTVQPYEGEPRVSNEDFDED